MKVINIKTEKLLPYDKNAKVHSERQINGVAESIRQFGFVQPLVVDKNNEVIIGHCRLLAAKQLNLDEIPCVMADTLTPEEVKALRLADNKLNESEWNLNLLSLELEQLEVTDIDMSDFNFDLTEFEEEEEPQEEEKANERERTYKLYNLQFNDLERTTGKYQMPIIQKEIVNSPTKPPIGFNYVLNTKERDRAVHMFLDDYQIERLWTQPEQYVTKLSEFDCVFSPDFSLYSDMPIAMQIWNTYRSRLVGQILQDYGVRVIPTVSWGLPETFDFCFDGIESGSICVVSTIGVKRDGNAQKIWREGMDEMIKRIQPSAIWCYGGEVEYDYKGISVIYFDNEVIRQMKGRK